MAGKVDSLPPSPQINLSPPSWTAAPNFWIPDVNPGLTNGQGRQYYRSASTNDAGSTPKSSRYSNLDENAFHKWRTAMQCKQHVGTQEWVNCDQPHCLGLRTELHHLLECRYKLIGGCEERCLPLREGLRRFRNLHLEYRTISYTQFGHRHRNQSARNECVGLEGNEIQAKLQALSIERYVTESQFSPSSPEIKEPFRLLEREQDLDHDKPPAVPIVELVPLDQRNLSVVDGCFRKGYEWEKLSFLGKGSFGTTFLCYDKQKECHFAIKKIPVHGFHEDEVKLWESLSGKHPNILRLFGAIDDKKHVLIFMEYMNGGSVGDFLAARGALDEKSALLFLEQVLRGLNFMHEKSIVHGDVKGANVLMDELGIHVKLADFGSCVNLRSVESGDNPRLLGTLAFMAPEICRSEFPSTSADIWSVMCFLIQMLTGEAPWAEYRHQYEALNVFVIGSAKRPPQLPRCSVGVQELFAHGFKIEACLRPTAAELLQHRAFAPDYATMEPSFKDEGVEACELRDDANSQSEESQEYHSSPSPFVSDFDSSDEDEYFSSRELTDDCDGPGCFIVAGGNTSPKAKSVVFQSINHEGGKVALEDVQITIPADALQDSTRLGIRCLDAVHFYRPLVNADLYEDVKIVGHVHQLTPLGQEFHKPVSVKLVLPESSHPTENLAIFHGSQDLSTNNVTWSDITKSCTILPFKGSTTIEVSISHFSCLMAVKSLGTELLFAYLPLLYNAVTALFRFLVFIRRDPSSSGILEARVVMVRESFYSSSSIDAVDKYCICRKLKEEQFRLMFGSRREYAFHGESLQISYNSHESSEPHIVECSFGGEVAGSWRLDCGAMEEPQGGTVTIKRTTGGEVYKFQFWEHDTTSYVQDVLKLETLTYTNLMPIAKAIGLSEKEITKLVEETSANEEEQLKQITEHWRRKAGNNDIADIKNFVANVPKEAILVSDRGKFHLGHLMTFKEKWDKKKDPNGAIERNELFFRDMAITGKEICQSVLSDCLLQLDHSEDEIRTATDIEEMGECLQKLVQTVSKDYPGGVVKLSELREELVTMSERCHAANPTESQYFCQRLYRCIPWLMQIVKDLFKVHVSRPPTGLWGLAPGTAEIDVVKTAKQSLPCNEIWCQLCEILGKLCENNTRPGGVDIGEMKRTLNVPGMLTFLSVCDREWNLLAARVKYFRQFAMEITRNTLPEISKQDLQNVLMWLQRYVEFCPSHLVQFSIPALSSSVDQEPLQYDRESRHFKQRFDLTVQDVSVAEVRLKVDISVNGIRHSELVGISLELCERGDSQICCKTVNVLYKHHEDGTGSLEITNECRTLDFRRGIEVSFNQTDGESRDERIEREERPGDLLSPSEPISEEPMNDDPAETTRIKEGSPSDEEIHKIACEIPLEWRPLGRRLLHSSVVESIDIDEHGVLEKAIKMLEKWKRTFSTSGATYRKLYEALCDETVSRRDIAEKYCMVKTAEL